MFNVFLAIFYIPNTVRYKSYFVNLFYYVDLLANAILAGNPDVTVSARTGYNAKLSREGKIKGRWYWNTCEKIINAAFKPIDGPDHCYNAYVWLSRHDNIHQGPMIAFIPGLLIVTLSCLILAPIIKVMALFQR